MKKITQKDNKKELQKAIYRMARRYGVKQAVISETESDSLIGGILAERDENIQIIDSAYEIDDEIIPKDNKIITTESYQLPATQRLKQTTRIIVESATSSYIHEVSGKRNIPKHLRGRVWITQWKHGIDIAATVGDKIGYRTPENNNYVISEVTDNSEQADDGFENPAEAMWEGEWIPRRVERQDEPSRKYFEPHTSKDNDILY
jgi:uncharacterized protein (UPF0147 family)